MMEPMFVFGIEQVLIQMSGPPIVFGIEQVLIQMMEPAAPWPYLSFSE